MSEFVQYYRHYPPKFLQTKGKVQCRGGRDGGGMWVWPDTSNTCKGSRDSP